MLQDRTPDRSVARLGSHTCYRRMLFAHAYHCHRPFPHQTKTTCNAHNLCALSVHFRDFFDKEKGRLQAEIEIAGPVTVYLLNYKFSLCMHTN
jgi:hypothetical protein